MSANAENLTEPHRSDTLGRQLLRGPGSRPLGAELQNQLAAVYHETRDPRLENKLVEANLRLVFKIARELDRSRGRFLEDLVQEGCLGLIEGVRRFDPAKGTHLSTYAGFWIRAFVMRHIMDNVRVVKVVRTRAERVAFFQGVVGGTEVSFEAATGPTGSPLRETLAEPKASAEVSIETAELAGRVKKEVAQLERRLPAREATILRERLLAEEPKPRREVGKRLSLSGERVRQIETTLRAAIQKSLNDGFVAAAA